MSRSIPAAIALLFALSAPHGALGQAPTLAEPAEAAVEAAAEAVVEVAETAAEAPAEEPVEAPAEEAPVAEIETPAELEPAVAPTPDPEPASVIVEPTPAYVVTPAPVCCPITVVAERTTIRAKRFLRCSGPQTPTTACVPNPADCGKLYAVPLCVPCCCTGEPRVCNTRAGLLGRGYADLVWDCGYVAKVTFLKHGGVIITYTAG